MNLRQYIFNAEKTYSYRIKTVVEMNDDLMGRIERVILKYQPLEMSSPRKTMMQKTPLDFPTVPVAEVHMVDVELGLPASAAQLQMELVKALGLPEKFVVVRGDNDPLEAQNNAIEAGLAMDEAEKDAKPGALLDLPNYEEGEEPGKELYGDAYNKRFLGYLNKIDAERREAMKKDSPNSPFKWLDMPKNDIADDEGPTIGSENAGENGDERVSGEGNLDDNKKTYTRAYQKQGKVYVKRETNTPIRKGK